jgi:Kef-type K+ transport system membrane component KefB
VNIAGGAAVTGTHKNELMLFYTLLELALIVLAGRESSMIAYMMNTRGLMELIVINVGLDLGVISPKLFTMLVIMAIFSTVITTPALRYYLPKTSRIGIERAA